MRTLSISANLLSAVTLSACVSATSVPSYEGKAEEWALKIEPLIEALEDPDRRTQISALDLKTGVYRGVLHGSSEYEGLVNSILCDNRCKWIGKVGELEIWRNYIADAEIVVDLNNPSNFTGTLSNFLTDFPGYRTLSGTVEFSGDLSQVDVRGAPAVVFNNMAGEGTLRSAGVDVLFVDVQDGGAIIGSSNGAVASGFMQTDFEWVSDTPFKGLVAEWDGALFLIRQ